MKNKNTNRITVLPKDPAPAIASRDAAAMVVTQICLTTITRNQLLSDRDAKIAAINQEYEPGLAACQEAMNIRTEQLHQWAQANPKEFDNQKKSIEFTNGTIGFRIGQPALKLLSKHTWDDVLARLQEFAAFKYIRTKQEPDKALLIADRETLGQEKLRAIGVKVTQAETFYVDPNLDTPETKQVLAAPVSAPSAKPLRASA